MWHKMTFTNISGAFGEVLPIRGNVPHKGIDLPFPTGTEVRSIVDGVIVRTYENETIGKAVIVHGNDNNYYIFGHLSKIKCVVGQKIHAASDILGLTGSTGNSTAPHLHFGIQKADGTFLDPTPVSEQLANVTGKIMADANGFYLFGKPEPGSILDRLNNFADWFVGNEVKHAVKPAGAGIKWIATNIWDWFVVNLPDIMGYGTILTGILVILSVMAGRGMIKPLAIYSVLLIIALCILAGV